MKSFWGFTMSMALLTAVGCGPGYPVVEVSGIITLDDEPLANATIVTQPIGTKENITPGPGSIAETDADGHFVLAFQHEDRVGAVPGEVSVKIVQNEKEKRASSDDTAIVVRSRVPLDYQEGKAKFTIPEEGTDAMNFDLKSERGRR